ncbi:hypothetical protein NicSoilB8_06210 [Arthrobacter sp. NicSoilB8]|nr:hypothetical protein NicSoilB8_06210 [Arthrobacter sp. NicSoilB8]
MQQRITVRGPATAPGIGRVGIPDKQLGTVDNHHLATFCKGSLNVAPAPRPDKGPGTRWPLTAMTAGRIL